MIGLEITNITMNPNITKYLDLKAGLKNLKSELDELLEEDEQYKEFLDEKKAVTEVYKAYKDKMIAERPNCGSIAKKISDKKNELKIIKSAILEGIIVTVADAQSGEQLSLPFKV